MGSAGHLSYWDPECIVDVDEATNVDMTWQSGGMRTYCEVELSEREFGSAKDDERHRGKLERIYRPDLVGAFPPEWLQPERFFQHYQLFRNVWLVAREPGSNLAFLAPRANTQIWRKLTAFFGILHEPLATRVRAVAIEDVIDSLAAVNDLPPALRTYAELLREKYVLPTLA